MCGIVGVVTTELNSQHNHHTDWFKQALFVDALRGLDSTGMFVSDSKSPLKSPTIYKRAVASPDFLQFKKSQSLLSLSIDYNTAIGHNRAATRGTITDETAHPFQYGHITMVHNGTIYNHKSLFGGTKFDVDSEAICYALANDNFKKVLESLDGAFALVWYNSEEGSLNFIRNEERPLTFARIKNKSTILIASEAKMLSWLAGRNGLEIDQLLTPNPGQLFTFYPDKNVKDWDTKPKTELIKIKEKKPFKQNYLYDDYDDFYGYKSRKSPQSQSKGHVLTLEEKRNNMSQLAKDLCQKAGVNIYLPMRLKKAKFEKYDNARQGYGKVTGVFDTVKTSHLAMIHGLTEKTGNDMDGKELDVYVCNAWVNNSDKVLHLACDDTSYVIRNEYSKNNEKNIQDRSKPVPMYMGPNRTYVSEKVFDEMTKEGCQACGADVMKEDSEKTGWTLDGFPICKDCVEKDEYSNYLN